MTFQDQPVEDGSTEATDNDKLEGIVEQTKQDVAVGSIPGGDMRDVLLTRISDAGLTVDDKTLARLLESSEG
ncbi:hypothetical protein HDC94_000681 [Leifsonia sp. AK011]|uniref:hypothetical protein n=1 Tax=Leifsonia sp. AK011 TaxID=2723075 RepID=UPI0015C8838A|nr:hypothetical protein [Leifsonia sp. AK011]NYF09525.1 hypothetical protein [Leifsonia sp. AK011]